LLVNVVIVTEMSPFPCVTARESISVVVVVKSQTASCCGEKLCPPKMSGKKLLDPRAGDQSTADGTALFGTSFILDPMEAERIIENLHLFSLNEIGSSEWMQQHEKLEKLNLQAHQSALTHSDEFILESFLTFSKIEFLINDLILIEIWKEYLFPSLLPHLAHKNSMRLYFILYHEATIINLLEIFFYHKHVCESCCGGNGNGDRLIELIDYVARKLTKLNGGYDFRGMDSLDNAISEMKSNLRDPKDFTQTLALETSSSSDELMKHLKEIEFRICISAISMSRFLCEHADNLPLNIISRICDTHDLLMLIVPLVENPPWTRRLTTGRPNFLSLSLSLSLS
jgi:zinc finger MYND domain-containing protein 10